MESSYTAIGSLRKLAELRAEIDRTEREVESMMENAVIEAIDLAANNQTLNGKKLVFNDELAKIYLVFRKKYVLPEEDVVLARLIEDIDKAEFQASQENAEHLKRIELQIGELQAAIAQLEEERAKVLNTKYLKRLKKELHNRREETSYISPTLAVFVTKEKREI